MAYLLDTNAIVALMKNPPKVIAKVKQVGKAARRAAVSSLLKIVYSINDTNLYGGIFPPYIPAVLGKCKIAKIINPKAI